MAENRATRRSHTIEWVNEYGAVKDSQMSSTRKSRAEREVERLRNTRKDEGLTPRLRNRQ